VVNTEEQRTAIFPIFSFSLDNPEKIPYHGRVPRKGSSWRPHGSRSWMRHTRWIPSASGLRISGSDSKTFIVAIAMIKVFFYEDLNPMRRRPSF
jgi:hypothetical protein